MVRKCYKYFTNFNFLQQTISVAGTISKSIGAPGAQIRLLQTVENVFQGMKSTEKSFKTVINDIDFTCNAYYPNNVKKDDDVKLLSGATVTLSTDSLAKSSGNVINILSMVYEPKPGSFNASLDSSESSAYFLTSPIWTNVVLVNNKSEHSLNVFMKFKCNNKTCDETAVCVFWNFDLNKWSTEGCKTILVNGSTHCDCNHLTSFSVLMADSLPADNHSNQLLDTITKTLLPISIGSLLNCIAIQIILLRQAKSSIALYRHICIMHIAVFLIISNISFMASSLFDVTAYRFLCNVLTFVTHFSLLAFFSWTLVQGIFLVCQLLFVFHHFTKKEFLFLTVVFGYLCPSSIAGVTFVKYYPNRYLKSNACWLDSRYGATLFFIVPAIIIMGGNIIILIIVIAKVLTPSVSEGKSENDEVVKKLMKAVLFCTPQFGLTWAIGIPMYVYPQATALHYMFALLNPLQGFFLLLFGCLLDKKVIDTLKEVFLKKPSPKNLPR
ncbi:adhesion G-protein coupled receptor F3-like [Pyxicephalus adspersus]|uniref:adhesion G-protein coupled receptor F3-like n=1 Tax=Pyxicephalus adspersus TaxID=30357 RepID=UPI003B5CA946